MAEAFAKKHGLSAQSAGSISSPRINPIVVKAMQERGMGCSIDEACPKPINCPDAVETD